MDGTHPKLWMTVAEAAGYLSCSEDSVERRLLKLPAEFERGRVRFRRIDDWNAVSTSDRPRATPIRLLGEDVYELLPLPGGVVEHGEQQETWKGNQSLHGNSNCQSQID